MQKIINIMLATAMMLLIISCSDDGNQVEPENQGTIPIVLIPAGTFQMRQPGAYGAPNVDFPIHTVTISKAFYMSQYEITQKQYKAIMDTNPSTFIGENFPVEKVTWYDAVAFCNGLSLKEGKTPCYIINDTIVTCNWEANGYRLPTEAEWEYACKAGTTTDFYSGNLTNPDRTPLDMNLDKIGWYCGNANSSIHEVGHKEANAFGLYDMSGNVNEWCWNWFSTDSDAAVTDPKGSLTGFYRVSRGGSFNMHAHDCLSVAHCAGTPSFIFEGVGFRIVRSN